MGVNHPLNFSKISDHFDLSNFLSILLKKTMNELTQSYTGELVEKSMEEIKFRHKLEIQELQLIIHKLENKIEILNAIIQSRENPDNCNF